MSGFESVAFESIISFLQREQKEMLEFCKARHLSADAFELLDYIKFKQLNPFRQAILLEALRAGQKIDDLIQNEDKRN